MRSKFGLPLALVLICALARAQVDSGEEEKPASLYGMVTNSLTGEPLGHAHVQLRLREGTGPTSYGAVTNADGRFSITRIAAGKYFLTAERRGYGPVNGSWSFGGERDPKELIFKSGQEVKDVLVSLVPDSVIAGRVVDADGMPVEQVTVRTVNGSSPRSAQTDDRGEFRIGGLRPGRYLVRASMDAPLPQEIRTDGTVDINYGPTYYPSSRSEKSAAPVQVHAGLETSGIEIKLLPAPILHVSGSVSNIPKTANGQVSVNLSGGLARSIYPVGPDGKFTIPRVPPGRYLLLGEYFAGSGKVFRSAPAEINLMNSSIEGIHLALSPRVELTGQVRAEGDAQIAGNRGTPEIELRSLGRLEHTDDDVYVAEDGSFKVTDVSPARYHVLINGLKGNFYVKSVRLDGREFQDGILDLRGGPAKAVLTIQLGADGAEISGVVRDPKGPAADAEVALFFDDEYGFDLVDAAATRADGSYVFHGIAPGQYKILAYDPRNTGQAWSAEAMALYDSVTERIEAGRADKIAQDLKLLISR